ncbi:hypothetical protein PCAR4_50030 [Paraburkholderia caribensis]|nr:hypothetical protein PCAR4_50030 [Paraburkholderia caribensis]
MRQSPGFEHPLCLTRAAVVSTDRGRTRFERAEHFVEPVGARALRWHEPGRKHGVEPGAPV